MTFQETEEIKELLSKRKNIVIVTHKNPDGDAMGSSLGLYNYLLKKGHRVKVVTPNSYPVFLHWLPGNEFVLDFEKQSDKASSVIKNAHIIFCLDFNALKRIGQVGELVRKSKAIKVLIDHHPQPERFARYMISDKRSSSTSQLVFDFIAGMGDKDLVNRKMANCLYTGIMTDTLNFKIPTTTAATHQIVAELIRAGAQNTLAYSMIFDTYTEDRVRMLGYSLDREMKVLKEYNAAFIALNRSSLEKFNFRKGDTEGFVNYPLSIEGIRFSALFLELQDEIKISFRSKGDFDVNQFARKHFNGGGHANAAGGEEHVSLDEAISKFIAILPVYKEKLLS